MSKIQLMVDFETLDVGSSSVVLSLGAVLFDSEIRHQFYSKFNIQEQIDSGRTIRASTLAWWMSQSKDARDVFEEKESPVNDVLDDFLMWLETNSQGKTVQVWGNGATFDVSMFEHLLLQRGRKVPWSFGDIRDLRTFKEYVAKNAKIPREKGIAHNALSDAINQANYVIAYTRG